VHQEKLEALEEIIEAANGHPVLVFYSYRHDKERIKKHLKNYQVAELQSTADIEKLE
jgi:superfamily II DNA/RNA helicase